MSKLLQIEFERSRPGIRVASLRGEIDASNVGQVRRRLVSAVGNSDIALLLDCSGLTYVDSTGCRLVFEIGELMQQRSQQLRLVVPPSSPILRVLEITGISAFAPIDSSLEDALRSAELAIGGGTE